MKFMRAMYVAALVYAAGCCQDTHLHARHRR